MQPLERDAGVCFQREVISLLILLRRGAFVCSLAKTRMRCVGGAKLNKHKAARPELAGEGLSAAAVLAPTTVSSGSWPRHVLAPPLLQRARLQPRFVFITFPFTGGALRAQDNKDVEGR